MLYLCKSNDPLYLVNLVTKRQLVNILFDLKIHTYDGRWQSQNINWKFKAISRNASLLVYDTKWDTLCKARTAFSKRIVKFSVIAMSFAHWCCSYSLNNSSKSLKNKLQWLFILFWSACVTSRSLPSAILPSDKFSSLQTLSVETGQLGPNLLTRIFLLLTRTLSRWSWQVLGSWNLDVRKCLSSSKYIFFELIFFCWFYDWLQCWNWEVDGVDVERKLLN